MNPAGRDAIIEYNLANGLIDTRRHNSQVDSPTVSSDAVFATFSSAVRIEMPRSVFVATVTGGDDREYLAELITTLYGILSERIESQRPGAVTNKKGQ